MKISGAVYRRDYGVNKAYRAKVTANNSHLIRGEAYRSNYVRREHWEVINKRTGESTEISGVFLPYGEMIFYNRKLWNLLYSLIKELDGLDW